MQSKFMLLVLAIGTFAFQVGATSLRSKANGAPGSLNIPVPQEGASSGKGVGDLKDFAHLLPFHPRGQQELLMKTRCVNFLNHILEKSAYSPEAVGGLMPKCKWLPAECQALKDDLMKRLVKGGAPGPAPAPAPAALMQQPVAERKAPQQGSTPWINGPRGPQPDFITEGGMDESIYGWCDTMYDMMRKKAIGEIEEEQKKAQEAKTAKVVTKVETEVEDDE
jgi:hypothetical protein